jgi:hypothetical protein
MRLRSWCWQFPRCCFSAFSVTRLFQGGGEGVKIAARSWQKAQPATLTPSMRSALADLKLEQLIVLYPGSQAYELEPRVRVLPISALAGATVEALFPKKRRTRAAPEVR